jgi:NAD(P)H dehydrogenase (quinone)
MSQNLKPTLLVTGASGHFGRRAVELLLEANAGTIIATTRTPEKLADFASRGVVVRHADFDQPETLATAFAGADRLLLISTDTMDVPGHRIKQHQDAVQAADRAGVRHVVYTSIVKPNPESPIVVVPDHHATEQALEASKMGWTVLRNNIYAEVLLGGLINAMKLGALYAAAGDGKTGYVTREDCARAAAAALASDFEGRRVLDITGPEALSQADVAAIASKLVGREINYVALPLQALVDNMVGAGLPRPMAEAYASFDTGIEQGFLNVVSSGVQDLTGRSPIRVADFLAEHRAALVPAAQ